MCVQIATFDADFLAAGVQGDSFGGVVVDSVDVGVGDGLDAGVFLSEFEHDRSIFSATRPAVSVRGRLTCVQRDDWPHSQWPDESEWDQIERQIFPTWQPIS